MKIDSIEIQPFELRLRRPLGTARAVYETRAGFVVRALDGRTPAASGWGEATPLSEHGTETLDECASALAAAAAEIRGHTIETIADVDELLSALCWPHRPAARHGLELALLDLLARRRRWPLARLFSAEPADRVETALLLDAEPGAEAAAAVRSRDAGFRWLKLKVARSSVEDDVARIRAIREALGPGEDVLLRLDANGGWTVEQAVNALRRVEPFGIALCEQPVAEAARLGEVRAAVRVPIAADESLANPADLDLILHTRAVQVLVLKPMVQGGLLAAFRIAIRAHRAGIESLVSSSLDGAIARTAAVHLACALPAPRTAAGLGTSGLFAGDLCADPCRLERGWLVRSDRPGLGIDDVVPCASRS